MDEEKITVSRNVDSIENGDYSLSSGKQRIDDLWLSLMSITDPVQIIKDNYKGLPADELQKKIGEVLNVMIAAAEKESGTQEQI